MLECIVSFSWAILLTARGLLVKSVRKWQVKMENKTDQVVLSYTETKQSCQSTVSFTLRMFSGNWAAHRTTASSTASLWFHCGLLKAVSVLAVKRRLQAPGFTNWVKRGLPEPGNGTFFLLKTGRKCYIPKREIWFITQSLHAVTKIKRGLYSQGHKLSNKSDGIGLLC